jgi:arylsulfatase A
MQINRFFDTHKSLMTIATGISLLGFSGIQTSTGAESATSDIDDIRGSKPNIIFILADDMGYNDLSINGQTNFKTPALDKMVSEGMFLADHYSGNTVCAPSRAALLTGQHTGHVYQRGNGMIEFRLDPLDITIATRLQDVGYHTALIGKSGVGCNSDNATLPNDKGFDHFFGFLAHAAAHRFYPKQLTRNGKTISYPVNDGHTGELYSGDLFLDDALNYLDHQGTTDQPFFLHLAIQQPHADLSAPEDFVSHSSGNLKKIPALQEAIVLRITPPRHMRP